MSLPLSHYNIDFLFKSYNLKTDIEKLNFQEFIQSNPHISHDDLQMIDAGNEDFRIHLLKQLSTKSYYAIHDILKKAKDRFSKNDYFGNVKMIKIPTILDPAAKPNFDKVYTPAPSVQVSSSTSKDVTSSLNDILKYLQTTATEVSEKVIDKVKIALEYAKGHKLNVAGGALLLMSVLMYLNRHTKSIKKKSKSKSKLKSKSEVKKRKKRTRKQKEIRIIIETQKRKN